MDIRDAIRRLALSGTEMYLRVCTVDAVDEQARTVDCTPIDEGAPLLGVNLQADQGQTGGIVSFPAVGSEVVVGFINPAVAVVVLAMEVTRWAVYVDGTALEIQKGVSVWNGGSETTANATELQRQLNICRARIDAIINALSSSPVTPQDGGAAYKAAVSSALSALATEDYSGIIDDKIKH